MMSGFVADGIFFPRFFLFSRESLYISFFLLTFQFQSLCFLLLNFIIDPFIKFYYVFNLVLKLYFVIYYFQ